MVETGTSYGAAGRWRATLHIRRKPASHLIHAIRVAETLGLTLNQFVTFNLAKTTCPPEQISSQFERLRDTYFVPWLRRAGRSGPTTTPAYVWSIENAGCPNIH